MRPFKSLISLPIKDSLLLVWSRITLSKITVLYFLFSFLHAGLQIVLQAEVFSINSQATNLVSTVIDKANISTIGFSFLKENELLWCNDPTKIPGSCITLWSIDGNSSKIVNTNYSTVGSQDMNPSQYSAVSSSLSDASPGSPKIIGSGAINLPQQTVKATSTVPINVQPSETAFLSTEQEVEIAESVIAQHNSKQQSKREERSSALDSATESILEDPRCLTALGWPLETLRNTKREDIVFLNFHVWVLGMSIVAILNESLVHMLATLLTHAFLTAWSIFQILSTRAFQNNFNRIITHGACSGTHLLPDYWKERTMVEIPAAALNGAALVFSALLTWRLVVTYNWATFKRIGANRKVSKAYKLVLCFSVALQLSLFFIVVSIALWIDQLCNGAIGRFALLMNVYRAIYISVLICLVPWIVIGWRAVRNEHRILMSGFLGFDILIVGGWASMFASTTFRLTFLQWRFFAIMSVVAIVLTLSCLIFGIICRTNFGCDLKRHLNGEESLPDGFVSATPFGNRDSVYSYDEKVAFPNSTLPSFSRITSNSSTDTRTLSEFSLDRNQSIESKSGTISGPIIVPRSRFSLDSNDGDSSDLSDSSHRRNGSDQSKGSRRWIIE